MLILPLSIHFDLYIYHVGHGNWNINMGPDLQVNNGVANGISTRSYVKTPIMQYNGHSRTENPIIVWELEI